MSKDITIHSYVSNNGIKDAPRDPLVHLLADDGYGCVQSISFHPDDAPAVADAILKAGRAAKRGRDRRPQTITFKPQA